MVTELLPNWSERVVFSKEGPQPQALYNDEQFKVVLAGLEPGQIIPDHPEGRSVYHFLSGEGVMTADGETIPVSAGTTLVLSDGTVRGLQARSRLVFLAARVATPNGA